MGKSNIHSIVRRYERHGIDAILYCKFKSFSINEKIAIIKRYYEGESKTSLAVEINMSNSVVLSWIKEHEQLG